MLYDLIVQNADLVTESGVVHGWFAVSDGMIRKICCGEAIPSAHEIVDAKGNMVFPGAIDTHPHLFDPGYEWREDYAHGTRAAASGGFTTLLDMPNTSPPVRNKQTFHLKMGRALDHAVIDYAFWGAALPDNIEDIESLQKLGCVGFKAFTIDAASDYPWADDYAQLKLMEKIADLSGIFGAHAENRNMVQHFTAEQADSPWSLKTHDASRPWQAELAAINTLLLFARITGCRLHICHMSIPEGAQMIDEARKHGVDVTIETCAHYLTSNWETDSAISTFAKINPPLRDRARMEALWEYVKTGVIDYLGTDHAPYLRIEKIPESGDLREAACGAPEIDIAIPLLLEEGVLNRAMTPECFAAFTAGNAAKRFGLYPQKGALREGADADFYIIDLNCPWVHTRANSFSKSKDVGFAHEGRQMRCKILSTYVRGKAVYRDGKILQAPGFGKFVRPRPC